MQLEALYRLDYPLYDSNAADGVLPTRYDPALRIENQPLGLLFQFTAQPMGLSLELEADAVQVRWQWCNVDSFLAGEAYFGYPSPVLPGSALGELVGSELQKICFGLVGGYTPTETSGVWRWLEKMKALVGSRTRGESLFFGVKLQFEVKSLVFVNQADEGYYLFEDTQEYYQYFKWFKGFLGQPVWVEQPQLLAQLAQA
ncbi:MAG: hypothetical protein ACRYFX_07740 [Janthinobacterium lividum]